MNTFNKKLFSKLLTEAIGEMTLNAYARECKVAASHLSRLKRGLLPVPPTPQTLYNIAQKAQNGVTYEELMKAAGYIEEKKCPPENISDYDPVFQKAKKYQVTPDKLEKLIDVLKNEN